MRSTPFDTFSFDQLCIPFGTSSNDYSYFDALRNRYGIYVIQEKENGSVLYVGEAHAQDLKTHITQNYTENNSGGTFRKNWCSASGSSFEEFKAALEKWTIKTVSIESESKDLIRAIEAILISVLKPLHNK